MSSSGYDQYIIQKYRLAVAIAVIKTKPMDKSIDEHLNKLKAKINHSNISDDDITICEDDFNIDNDDSIINLDDIINDKVNDNDLNETNDSVTILKDFDINIPVDEKQNSLVDVIQVLNNIDENRDKDQVKFNSQSTYFDSSQNSEINFINNETNIVNNDITFYEDLSQTHDKIQILSEKYDNTRRNNENFDSQKTVLYTFQGFTEYNTHFSQSQDNIIVEQKLLTKRKSDSIESLIKPRSIQANSPNNELNSDTNLVKNDKFVGNNLLEAKNNIQETLNNTIVERNKRLKLDIETQTNLTNTQNSNNYNRNINISNDSLNTISQLLNTLDSSNSTQRFKEVINISQNTHSLDEFEHFLESQSLVKTNNIDNTRNKEKQRNTDPNCNIEKSRNREIENDISEIHNLNEFSNDEVTQKFSDNDLTDSQVEVVTFKVLEELSKVKSYLNRKEKRSNKTDSGYRSFQRNSCDSASQNSGVWINESAHCLTVFLTTNPLLMNTREITDEISKVLGKLIDKLHEDEIYPNFLEEMLDTVNRLLHSVHDGRNYGDNILNKDETIQRLFLLNRSQHIIKYTIEKITDILEVTLENLQNIEITHTDRTENICHIFYILEDLLKRNDRYKNDSSQSTSQNTQEILKKSSLTEIWRKKWNLSQTEVFEGSREKKCVYTKCRVVLNKFIIQAMDGYSLMAFSALQCFNLLQE